MTKKTIFALAMLSLSLAACVAQIGPDGTAEPVTNMEQAQTATPPGGGGGACHIKSEGIVFGTMTESGWCCGVRLCDIKEACGDDYQKPVESCGLCSFYTCEGGWLRPANMSGDVLLYTGDKSPRVVSDEKGYAIPFTPMKQ